MPNVTHRLLEKYSNICVNHLTKEQKNQTRLPLSTNEPENEYNTQTKHINVLYLVDKN